MNRVKLGGLFFYLDGMIPGIKEIASLNCFFGQSIVQRMFNFIRSHCDISHYLTAVKSADVKLCALSKRDFVHSLAAQGELNHYKSTNQDARLQPHSFKKLQ